MSKDPYYHVQRPGAPPDGGLPSFPSTSYWYDAHADSTAAVGIFPQSTSVPSDPTVSYGFKREHCDSKFVRRRDEFDGWSDGMQQSSMPKTFDSQYWGDEAAKEFAPPCDISSDSAMDYEPSRQPLHLLSPEVIPQQDGVSSVEMGSSMYLMESVPHDAYSDRLPSSSAASTEDYFSNSNNSSDIIFSTKKKSSADAFPSDDSKKNHQKRQKKESKEKVKEEKRCGVCGDAARSMHFGGMACDSCKAFFRRSVQSGAYKNFQCPENEDCPISKQNRKVCQYCRFKKSQENGMEISWVMSETDRMTLWKNRLAKQRHIQEEKTKEEVYGDLPRTLDPTEADKLRNLASLQETTFEAISYPEDCYGDCVESLANLFVCVCKKLGMFFNKVEDFSEVCKNDQSLLLKNGIGMSIYLHGAYMYDYQNERWPCDSNKEALKIPRISMTTLEAFTKFPDAFGVIMKFYKKYGREMKDEIILALMCVIAFFQPDDPQFIYPNKIQDIQVRYLEHLRHYLLAKEGDSGVKVTFPKLLVGLADIREILEFHNKVAITPTINHQQIPMQSTLKYQMAAAYDIFMRNAEGPFPDFSSVLSASESQHPMWQNGERRLQGHKVGAIVRATSEQFYHPQTNQIFGCDPRTDMIITNPMGHIDHFIKKHKLTFAQVSEVTDSSNTSTALQPKYQKRNHGSDSDSGRSSGGSSPYSQPESPSKQLQLVPQSGSWQNSRCLSPPVDRQRMMEYLCDILKNISCSNDDVFLESVKQTLPPQFLDSLQNSPTV